MHPRLRRELIQRLVRDARAIASHFGVEYRSIQAERGNVKSRYGICYEDGSIKIRLAHAVSGRPLKYSSLVSTLCHELAHLRHFDHSPRFRLLYQEMLEWSRAAGIYRPGPRSAPAPLVRQPAPVASVAPPEPPRQLELFG